jgi:Transposase domain (DUF772)
VLSRWPPKSTALAYAYCVGERSSRGIERRCREDVAFRVITANQAPDHATIARFRVRHQEALADLLGQVLGLCAEGGLVEVGVLAVDGSKFAAAASDSAIRTYEELAREVLAEAAEADAAEDERYGTARGDELPDHLATRQGRQGWLRQAKRRLDAKRAKEKQPIPRGREERLELCHERLVEDWRAQRQGARAYEAYRERSVRERGRQPMGPGPKPYTPPPRPEGKINTTDPDARRMKFGRNFIPAYNAQAVTTEGQVIVAAEITTEGGDFEQLDRMIRAAERELQGAGVKAKPEVVLADADYWSNDHLDALRERGMIPIVAPDTTCGRPRKTRLGGPYDFMRRVLDTERGGALYIQADADGRAGLRSDQGEPADRPAQTKGPGRGPLGMAPHCRHPQPPEALPQRFGPGRGLNATDPASRRIRGAAQPPFSSLCATASRESRSGAELDGSQVGAELEAKPSPEISPELPRTQGVLGDFQARNTVSISEGSGPRAAPAELRSRPRRAPRQPGDAPMAISTFPGQSGHLPLAVGNAG